MSLILLLLHGPTMYKQRLELFSSLYSVEVRVFPSSVSIVILLYCSDNLKLCLPAFFYLYFHWDVYTNLSQLTFTNLTQSLYAMNRMSFAKSNFRRTLFRGHTVCQRLLYGIQWSRPPTSTSTGSFSFSSQLLTLFTDRTYIVHTSNYFEVPSYCIP